MAKDEKPPRTTELFLKGQQRRMVEKRETPKWPRNEEDKLLVSIVDSIPACHAGDRGSIPRRGESACLFIFPGLSRGKANCIGLKLHCCICRESNPGLPCGRQEFCQRVNREEWSKNKQPPNGHISATSSMYQSIFLQLNVVHWNPLCWGIPLALKWGFYLAQVESYSHLKNGCV